MAEPLRIRVHGTPAPQGSKKHVGNGIMVESSKRVTPWRQDVRAAALEELAGRPGFPVGPVEVETIFLIARLGSHWGTGRNAGTLKPSAPQWVSTRPDLDKYVRATLDALGEAGVFRADAQVVRLTASKVYATGEPPGATITIRALTNELTP